MTQRNLASEDECGGPEPPHDRPNSIAGLALEQHKQEAADVLYFLSQPWSLPRFVAPQCLSSRPKRSPNKANVELLLAPASVARSSHCDPLYWHSESCRHSAELGKGGDRQRALQPGLGSKRLSA